MDLSARDSPPAIPSDLYSLTKQAYGDAGKSVSVANDIIDYYNYLVQSNRRGDAEKFVQQSLQDLREMASERSSYTSKVLQFVKSESKNLGIGASAVIVGTVILTYLGYHG